MSKASAQHHARGQQQAKAPAKRHRQLRKRPDKGQRQQDAARLKPVDEKPDDDRKHRKAQKEGGANKPELAMVQPQITHDRPGCEPQNRAVCIIDEHEEEEEGEEVMVSDEEDIDLEDDDCMERMKVCI